MGSTNFKEFNAEITRETKKIKSDDVFEFVRRIAFDVLSGAVLGSPVISGFLRGNWQVGIASIPQTKLPEDKEGAGTISKAEKMLRALKENPYVIIYVVNNMGYASYVEEGTLSMAPRAMLLNSILAAENKYGA